MPIYEYTCHSCGQAFERFFRSIHHSPTNVQCPGCQSAEVQRLVSAPTVRTARTDIRSVSEEGSTTKPVIFGRKELEAAQEKKRQLRDQADYETKKK